MPGNLADHGGVVKKSLLIMGTGATLWRDLSCYDHLHRGSRLGINMAIVAYPNHLDYAASLHPDILEHFLAYRHVHVQVSNDPTLPVDISRVRGDGLSGLSAVLWGLQEGFESIILAGVPLDNRGHFYSPYQREDLDYWATYGPVWKECAGTVFQGRVRSLSGNTRGLLGCPLHLMER